MTDPYDEADVVARVLLADLAASSADAQEEEQELPEDWMESNVHAAKFKAMWTSEGASKPDDDEPK